MEWCMRVALEFKRSAPPTEVDVVEVVTPRTNLATLTSAENLFAAIALAEPFSLEIAADGTCRQFLIRAAGPGMRQQLESQLGAAYPQAELRPLNPDTDPARQKAGEQLSACILELRAAEYLPIRTFSDLDVDGERAAQADPVLGILSALGDLPAGWRGLSQLVLQSAPEDWCRDYVRRSVQHPLEHERIAPPAESAAHTLGFVSALLGAVAAVLQGFAWLRGGQWLQLGGLAVALLVGLAVGLPALRRWSRPAMYDMDLVREKVTRVAYRCELRLAVYAPDSATHTELSAHLNRLAAAYRRYNLAAANGFVSRPLKLKGRDLQVPIRLGAARRQPILTTRELAGVWHLPHAAADIALLERTTARHWLPLPPSVAHGCRIGVSVHQARQVSVALPADLLVRHLLLVAKTRRGKSTLMLRLAHHAMESGPRRAVVLVDPHRDLAEAALSMVPRARGDATVFLDVAD